MRTFRRGPRSRDVDVEDEAAVLRGGGRGIDSESTAGRSTAGTFDAELNGFEPAADDEPNYLISRFFDTSGVRDYCGPSDPRLDYVLANGLKATRVSARGEPPRSSSTTRSATPRSAQASPASS